MKVLLGAWIGYEKPLNARELERAIALANANTDVVRALIVGNEVLLRRERTEDEMRELIRHAKANAKVPVTYADVWEFWTRHDSLAAEVDFVTVHILPFWRMIRWISTSRSPTSPKRGATSASISPARTC